MCDNPEEPDTTSPTVTITYPPVNIETVNELVTIIVSTSDNGGIDRVEFFISDLLLFTDTESPYEYEWNTLEFEDGEYTLRVISYDNSGNQSTTPTYQIMVDNTVSYPTHVVLYSITYQDSLFFITWSQNNDNDFNSYSLYESINENMSNRNEIYSTEDFLDTTYVHSIYPNFIKYYQIEVEDWLGLKSQSNIVLGNSEEIYSTFKIIQEQIFEPNCVSCHTEGNNFAIQSDLILTADVSYEQLIDRIPKNLSAAENGLFLIKSDIGALSWSFLWEKINAPNQDHLLLEHPEYGALMPLGMNYLTMGELDFIEKWIWEGAPDTGIVADEILLENTSRYSIPHFEALPPPENGIQIHLGPFEIDPGTEREFFYYQVLDTTTDIYIEKVEISMRQGSHHFIAYTFGEDLPISPPEENTIRDIRDHFGNYIFDNMWPMLFHKFVTGTQWQNLDFSFTEGVALRLSNSYGLDLNPHNLNYTDTTTFGEVYMNLHLLDPGEVEHVAEILVLNNLDISLAPEDTTILEHTFFFDDILESSVNDYASQVQIIQLFSHAHEKMIQFDVEVIDLFNPDTVLVYSTQDWEHPPVYNIDPPLTISPNQAIYVRTIYYNWTNEEVNFGLLSLDEMMILFGYFYVE